jgi:hypothetical protein
MEILEFQIVISIYLESLLRKQNYHYKYLRVRQNLLVLMGEFHQMKKF